MHIKYLEDSMNVSRETLETLKLFVNELLKWNKSINLIGKSTADEVWERHIIDSAQIIPYISIGEVILDIGSGAGLPGVVLSIIGKNRVILLERNQKKCAFLQSMKSKLNCNTEIKNVDLTQKSGNNYSVDVVTCRGVTTVCNMLELTFEIAKKRLFLLKGISHQKEIDEAKRKFNFDMIKKPSITSVGSEILILSNIKKVHG